MPFIYHIAKTVDWQQAQESGEYAVSTLGRTLQQEGFIHCSRENQVAGVANAFYRDVPNLVLLVIDPAMVTARIQYDEVPGVPDPYPHIYGPLNTDAVTEARPFTPGHS